MYAIRSYYAEKEVADLTKAKDDFTKNNGGTSLMGLTAPIFPLKNPGLLSIPIGFLAAILGALAFREKRAEEMFDELYVRQNRITSYNVCYTKLLRTGIGRLVIADFDLVEPSNLNRQQYFLDQLGQPKVYALRDTLLRINPYVHVAACHLRLTTENVGEVFGAVDILVEAFDRADQKAMLVETFCTLFPDKPLVAGSGMAGFGPSNSVRTRSHGHNLYVCGDEVVITSYSIHYTKLYE